MRFVSVNCHISACLPSWWVQGHLQQVEKRRLHGYVSISLPTCLFWSVCTPFVDVISRAAVVPACAHRLLRSQELLYVCSIIPVLMYLPVFYSSLLTGWQLSVPMCRRCHSMGSFNRMEPIQLMRVTHRRWVGVMTGIPVTRWDEGSAAKRRCIFSSCRSRFSGFALFCFVFLPLVSNQTFFFFFWALRKNIFVVANVKCCSSNLNFQSHSRVPTHSYALPRWHLVGWRRFSRCHHLSRCISLCSQWDLQRCVWLIQWLCCFSALKCRAGESNDFFFPPPSSGWSIWGQPLPVCDSAFLSGPSVASASRRKSACQLDHFHLIKLAPAAPLSLSVPPL